MSKEINGMIATKIPMEYRIFIEANPRLAKVVGNVIGNLVETYEKIEGIKDILKDPNYLAALIDVGTVDQASSFVDKALESAKSAIKINNVSREVLDLVKEKLGKDAFETIL